MRILGILSLLFATAALASPITTDSPVDDVLDALDARGKDLKTLTADVKMTVLDDLGDATKSRLGHLYYENRGNGKARFRALFDKTVTGKRVEEDKHDWLFTDGQLIDRDYHSKKQNTHQVLRPGEKMELFKLEGPFPLPLGQDKADVHKTFEVKKLSTAKDEPAGTVHLSLTPLKGTDLAKKFARIDLWIDPASAMPARIDAVDADGASSKETYLQNVKVNDLLKDENFQMDKVNLKDGWNETDDRFH